LPSAKFVIYSLFAAIFVLAGCGHNDAGKEPPRATSTSVPAVTTAPPPSVSGVTLLQTCPLVESVIVTLNGAPSAQQYGVARAQVQALSIAGNLETQNALAGLLSSLGTLQTAQAGSEFLAGHQAFLAALNNLAGRCKTVGSSALQ